MKKRNFSIHLKKWSVCNIDIKWASCLLLQQEMERVVQHGHVQNHYEKANHYPPLENPTQDFGQAPTNHNSYRQ
ncbi:unnamed protein product [Lathyrus oleraceus]